MIELVEIIEKKNHRYELHILVNGEPKKHLVSSDVVIKFNLIKPRKIDKEEYKKIIKVAEYDMLYIKAINYISYQMRTISEVKKHLKKDTKDEKLIECIIKELKTNRYLNDDHYVKEYISQKIEYDLVGPRYIKEKLIGKGIHFDLIDQNLLQYKEKYQYDKVYNLICHETKYPIKKPFHKAYVSIKNKLINKGFNVSIIEAQLLSHKDLIEEAVDDDGLLQKEFEKLCKKYNIANWDEKDKVVKALMSKGYHYKLIKQLFD